MLEGYETSRRYLFEALRALESLSAKGFVLVGAQAVYLRTTEIVLPIAPYTLDGDLVADPRWVRNPGEILLALKKQGFVLRGDHSGLYESSIATEDERRATRIDIFVPGRFSNDWDLDGYDVTASKATMTQDGLELAIRDYSMMAVPLPGSDESIELRVAGTVALSIAKAWKLGERYQKGPASFSEVWKDVFDLYRLLKSSDQRDWKASLSAIPREPAFVETARRGVDFLETIFSGSPSPATALIAPQMEPGAAREEVLTTLPLLVEEFSTTLEGWL